MSYKDLHLKRILALLLLLVACLLGQPKDQLFQVSTIDALLAGAYDGVFNIADFKEYGNFGLGTFDKLDGEMIVLDGNVYQAKSDGKVIKNSGPGTTPFVSLVNFESDTVCSIENVENFEELVKKITANITNKNLPVAVKLAGNFSYVKVRSVPAQEKPYSPLKEVVKDQAEFEYENLEGTIIGFILPEYFKSFNASGFHLHFLSQDESKGGHLLDAKFLSGKAELDQLNKLFVYLPPESEHFSNIDLNKDRSKELEKVEK